MAKVYKSPNPNRTRMRLCFTGAVLCGAGAAATAVCAAVLRKEIFLCLCVIALLGVCAWRLWNQAQVLKSGLAGESKAAKALAGLPQNYTVLCNVKLLVGAQRGEADAVVVGPNGVSVVEVKNHAGSLLGEANAQTWRQTRPVKGGRPLEKTLPNPLLQNQRQVQLVRRILGGEGLNCSVVGFVYFTNPYVSVHVRGGEAYTSAEELCRAVQRPHSPGLTPGEAKKAVLLLQGRR